MAFTSCNAMAENKPKLNQFNLVWVWDWFWLSAFILLENIHCRNRGNVNSAFTFISIG